MPAHRGLLITEATRRTPGESGIQSKELAAFDSDGEHAYLIRVRLSDDDLGTAADDEIVELIETAIIGALLETTARWDGHEFGGGWAVIFCYGRDAVALGKCITDAFLELELKRDIQLYNDSSGQIVTLVSCAMDH